MSSTGEDMRLLARLYHSELEASAKTMIVDVLDNSARQASFERLMEHANRIFNLIDHLAPLATEETFGEYPKSALPLVGVDDSA